MRSLCSINVRQRINSADYLLANFLEFDPHSPAHLIDLVRALPASYPLECKLWGLVNIVLKCRLLSIDMRDIPDEPLGESILAKSGPLLPQEVYWG